MTLKSEWIDFALGLSNKKADFYTGCRKILRQRRITFSSFDDSLTLADAGYTKSKMTMLIKNYLHEESIATAVTLWNLRREKRKYGSVSFTTFNHFVKGKGTVEEIIKAKEGTRASIFGPCIQSVMITWLKKDRAAVDIGYRTTEFFKKFPADLVFIRNVLLSRFDFTGMEYDVTFHFANITMHPQYVVTIIPHLDDPIASLEALKKRDEFYWAWCVKWTARYLCPEHHRGIAKFAQAMRVHMHAGKVIVGKDRDQLTKYLRENHPGFRNEYVPPEEDDED